MEAVRRIFGIRLDYDGDIDDILSDDEIDSDEWMENLYDDGMGFINTSEFIEAVDTCIRKGIGEDRVIGTIKVCPVDFKQIWLNATRLVRASAPVPASCEAMADILTANSSPPPCHLTITADDVEKVFKECKLARCIVLENSRYKLHRDCSKKKAYGFGGILGIAFLHRKGLQAGFHRYILKKLAGEKCTEKDYTASEDDGATEALVHGFQDATLYRRDRTLYGRYAITGEDLHKYLFGGSAGTF